MKARLLPFFALAIVAACRDVNSPTSTLSPPDPSKIISDGANGGNKDFFFLPPMVPLPLNNPDFELGKFNNTLRPNIRVDICELKPEMLNGTQVLPKASTECVAGDPLKRFAAGTVNLVNLPLKQNGWWTLFNLPPDGFYYVLWDTRQSNLNVSKYYRIKVFLEGLTEPLGIADVDPMSSLREWKYSLTGQVIQLVDDVMLPIPFRIEKGGGTSLCGNASLCVSASVSNSSTTGTQTVTLDGGGGAIAGASFPNGWLPATAPPSVIVTITSVDLGDTNNQNGSEAHPCHLDLPLQQVPGCFNFITTPRLPPIDKSGRQFAKDVTVAVCYSLQGSGDPREKFAEMYSSGPNEPSHPLQDTDDAGILSPATRNCSTPPVVTAAPSSGLAQFATASWRRIKNTVGSFFGVKTAYAVDLGLGGFTSAFSNVGPAITAAIQPVGPTSVTRAFGGNFQAYVRLIGSNHHDGEHQSSVGIPGLPVQFQVAAGNGAVADLGSEVGNATQLAVVTNNIALDQGSSVSGGGYAAVNWGVPSRPGVYHLTVSGAAFGGPVVFTVTVPTQIVDLGVLAGDTFSSAQAVNSSGQIVGYSGVSEGVTRAFLWADGVMNALNLPTDQGGDSRATGINDNGVVVGEMTIGGATHAFRWENGVTTDLGVPSWASSSRAAGINTGGTIVGWNNDVTGEEAHAWSWNVGGPITNLGVLPQSITNAAAINDVGQVVGSAGPGFESNSWIRQPNGVVTLLGGLGGLRSAALGINSAGTVVGGSDVVTGTLHPFVWSNGVMTDLGSLGGGFGVATGIGDDGRIVGSSNIATGENHAFLWQNGQMTDLGTLGGPRSNAEAIRGLRVVGNAVTTGNTLHATLWIVAPPQ